ADLDGPWHPDGGARDAVPAEAGGTAGAAPDERWWAPGPEEGTAPREPADGGPVEDAPAAQGAAGDRGTDRPERGPSPPDLIGDLRERFEHPPGADRDGPAPGPGERP